MNFEVNDRVLVIPLGVHGTVVRLRGEDTVVVMADCATQPVAWKLSEVDKALAASVDVEGGRVIAKDVTGHPLRRSYSRGEQGWDT